ncbi:MAG: fumarylacetoacetate hydrolase family protein [Saprospiraceae bacterium]|nr:fumarylacetoacetate hydrolase family protein [Saprospiraceae bacterium]
MFKLYKTPTKNFIEYQNAFYLSASTGWDKWINQENLITALKAEIKDQPSLSDPDILKLNQELIAPIGSQEVWAAGVTYLRSRDARMEESEVAKSAYDLVYEAERPEIFFKSTASRVAGPGQHVNIRKDSTWNVPEPEMTVCINCQGRIIGYTIGNDMSSRSIEGENTLYLPQAKTYERSAALGPCLLIQDAPLDPETRIELKIFREAACVFQGKTPWSSMIRKLEDLKGYLLRGLQFEQGCFLMTGTGIVPPSTFTLEEGDAVEISISGIGTLLNPVKRY